VKVFFPIVVVVLLAAIAVGVTLVAGHDENYELQEFVFRERFGRYDSQIVAAAERYGVSPALVKAVVWRESRFQSHMQGGHGERGLMQITEGAATDWARAERIETFVPTDLFDPKTNIEVGTWYLSRALKHWSAKDDPVPFALAEYNAGRTRVNRWQDSGTVGHEFGAGELAAAMDFPSTRDYVDGIMRRYRAFLQNGFFLDRSAERGD